MTQEQVDRAACGRRARTSSPTCSSAMHLTPGVGHRLRRAGADPRSCSSASTSLSALFALGPGLHHGRRHPADRLPAPRREVDEKLGRLPLRYFDSHPRGDLLSRVTNDIDNIGQSLQQSLTQLITSLLTIVGVLIMMLTISPLLAVVSLLAVPASLVVTVLIVRRSQKQFVAQWASTGALNGHVEEMHTGHAIVKVVRPPARGDRAVRRGERAALRGELPGAVHLRDHPAGR